MSRARERGRKAAPLNRRDFLHCGLIGGAIAAAGPGLPGGAHAAPTVPPFDLDEATIADLQAGMKAGRWTAAALAQKYLARIDALDKRGPSLRAIIELNPEALATAEALDKERKARGPRGPLHGIPVVVKDNIETGDRMQTTAGSLALAGFIAPRDAFIVERLRAAGAVILAKTNLSEWANIRSNHSSSGWSARGGQTRNPYVLDRNPCGSSSGSAVAVAANLAAAAIGTETDGSVTAPASVCGVVGIKPTVGLCGRSGIIPIAHSQDTAGPMARTVADAAILLGALAGVDPRDPATRDTRTRGHGDYTRFLDPAGLRGARIGVARKVYFGASEPADRVVEAALEVFKRLGATLIDPADIETAEKLNDPNSPELDVLLYELKSDLDAWLAAAGPHAPVHSLKEVIEFNQRHADRELLYFGQDLFVKAQAKGPLSSPEYVKAREACIQLAARDGIEATMTRHRLDAIIAPTLGPACLTDLVDGDHFVGGCTSPAAVAGFPHITLPVGFVFGLPIGISFMGRAWSEPQLIKYAYAFEQATRARRPPRFLPIADLGI
jgi:amidase